jgi:phosphatidylinositol glycan class O
LEDVVKALDNDTVLMVYGDHGMTDDGNHGGGTPNEMKTVLFAYTKGGFPMMKKSNSF